MSVTWLQHPLLLVVYYLCTTQPYPREKHGVAGYVSQNLRKRVNHFPDFIFKFCLCKDFGRQAKILFLLGNHSFFPTSPRVCVCDAFVTNDYAK